MVIAGSLWASLCSFAIRVVVITPSGILNPCNCTFDCGAASGKSEMICLSGSEDGMALFFKILAISTFLSFLISVICLLISCTSSGREGTVPSRINERRKNAIPTQAAIIKAAIPKVKEFSFDFLRIFSCCFFASQATEFALIRFGETHCGVFGVASEAFGAGFGEISCIEINYEYSRKKFVPFYHIIFLQKMQDNFQKNNQRRIIHTKQGKKTHFNITNENELTSVFTDLEPGDRIFFYGDLGSGKTTYIRHLLRHISGDDSLVVRSPTYIYYNEYKIKNFNIYHFDLYRCEDLDTFLSIGGYEILENPDNICLIEWPDLIKDEFEPSLVVEIQRQETA
ncbi:tRNA (adenosine(37)-N6)-threonylcarbamoyltransferase complex ATPase subunit type 1 TsaE [Candidatus Gracilibacteria bacterium]|nr:MAG: tRNA (adenosine(37)-N6)-threonylcarbamoyltransferase complex ATPase subunit type 1 TsaE [Candidatus Gracilibacteria bacterium]